MISNKLLSRVFDIENFKKYDNFYTLVNHKKYSYKRVYHIDDDEWVFDRFIQNETLVIVKDVNNLKPSWVYIGIKPHVLPIFGHFATNDNYFVFTNINKTNFKPLYNIEYLKNPLEKFIKPIDSNYYQYYDIEDFKRSYKTIKEYEDNIYKENIKDIIANIIQEDDFLMKKLYIYENETLTSLISSNLLKIYFKGELIT